MKYGSSTAIAFWEEPLVSIYEHNNVCTDCVPCVVVDGATGQPPTDAAPQIDAVGVNEVINSYINLNLKPAVTVTGAGNKSRLKTLDVPDAAHPTPTSLNVWSDTFVAKS